jgi:hypothetical protein
LLGKDLKSRIAEILREDQCRCAVAFWGKGSDTMLPARGKGNYRVVCNLAMGGTNPYAIEKLKLKNLRQLDSLHAKVFIGSDVAVVASANVSANGLGLEDIEQARWIEAGVEVPVTDELVEWFETLWNESKIVDGESLRAAKREWKKRQGIKPPLVGGFSEFDTEQKSVPLLYWVWGGHSWDYNDEQIREQLGSVDDAAKQIVDDSLEVSEPEDIKAMAPGNWVVVWEMGARDLPKRRPRPYWFRTGRLLRKSFRYKRTKDWCDSIAPAEIPPSEPFSFGDDRLLDAFVETLSQKKYANLRVVTESALYTTANLALHRQFWRDCKAAYLSRIGAPVGNVRDRSSGR